MKTALISALVLMFSPVAPREVPQEEAVTCDQTRAIGDDVQKCKNKCNSHCAGAQNKSKCVAECRRACEK
ncbi:MAG: hypothetical protein ACO1OB_26385 [Archangium sp.]